MMTLGEWGIRRHHGENPDKGLMWFERAAHIGDKRAIHLLKGLSTLAPDDRASELLVRLRQESSEEIEDDMLS